MISSLDDSSPPPPSSLFHHSYSFQFDRSHVCVSTCFDILFCDGKILHWGFGHLIGHLYVKNAFAISDFTSFLQRFPSQENLGLINVVWSSVQCNKAQFFVFLRGMFHICSHLWGLYLPQDGIVVHLCPVFCKSNAIGSTYRWKIAWW